MDTRYIKGWLHENTQRSRCLDCGRPNGRDGKPSGYWRPVVVSFAAAADTCDRCDQPMAGITLEDYRSKVAGSA